MAHWTGYAAEIHVVVELVNLFVVGHPVKWSAVQQLAKRHVKE